MNRILLINPSPNPNRNNPDILTDHVQKANLGLEPSFPLGIIYLGSYLKEKKYSVQLLDGRLHAKNEFMDILQKALEGVFLVGISTMTSYIKDTLDILSLVKQKNSKIKTVLGGIHPSLFPEQTVRHHLVDFVVFGEGELPLENLVIKLLHNEDSFEEIDNLCFEKNGNIVFKKAIKFIDINKLPIPDYSMLDVEKYIYRRFLDNRWGRQIDYQSSRGCPSRCSFCVNTIISKRRWRQKNPAEVVKEVALLKKRYDLDNIFFLDENFFPNKKNVGAIAKGLKDLSITWEANARANYFSDKYINDDFLKFLVSTGLTTFRIGIESGSPKILALLKKDIKEIDVINAVKTSCQKNKVFTSFSFMTGLPQEEKKDIIDTLNLINKIEKIGKNYVFVNGPQVYRPYPGGEIYDLCIQEGLDEPKTFEKWAELAYLETGYLDDFVWMKNKNFIKLVVILRSLVQDGKIQKKNWSFLKRLVRKFFYPFACLRSNLGFYEFMIDMRMANFIKSIYRMKISKNS